MLKKNSLFVDDGEDEEDFKINNDYATGYDRWRRNEELAKYKALGMEVDESSSSDSDEGGDGKTLAKPDNPEFDREFLLSLGTLYKIGKGENVDVGNVQFFKGDYRIEKENEEKPMTLKDFERQVIVERKGRYDEDDIDTTNQEYRVKDSEKINFDDGLEDSDDEGDGLLSSGLFKLKEDGNEKPMEENAPGNEAVAFVKGLSASVADPKQKHILETVKNVWTDKKLPKKEKWLMDFFLNKRYLEDNTSEGLNDIDPVIMEEEISDEEEMEEDNPLATQYKYRHQEPGDYIKRHPRNISDTLRPKDEKRKEKREVTKQRMQEKKEEKRKEIEVLKALKLKEIEEKIDKIREASGNEDIDLGDMDLESDFDPASHDKYMEQMFGDDYFDPSNAEQEIPDFEDVDDDTKLYDNWTRASTSHEDGQVDKGEETYAEYGDNENFSMDAEYDSQNINDVKTGKPKKTTRRKGRRHQSKFAQAAEREKPLFDPKEKNFESYFDEYYKLDFEDVVGGIPCRFKYRKVECNNFGLTTEEVLSAQNSDLNKWVGIKKILKYNRSKEDEQKDRVFYQNRSLYEHVKRKYMPSLFADTPEELAEQEREKRRLKNLKRKQKKWRLKQGITNISENIVEVEEKHTNDNGKRPLEVVDHGLPKEKHQWEQYTQNTSSGANEDNFTLKKKKKKNKHKETNAIESTPTIENSVRTEQKDEDSSPRKKKKKGGRAHDIQSTALEMETVEISNNCVGRKKKKHANQLAEAQEIPPSHKKKKKRSMETGVNTISVSGHKPQKKKNKVSGDSSNKKKYQNKDDKTAEYFKGISDARLEAYGQNPKKLKNRIKYGNDV